MGALYASWSSFMNTADTQHSRTHPKVTPRSQVPLGPLEPSQGSSLVFLMSQKKASNPHPVQQGRRFLPIFVGLPC